ncbi:hypothetical protein CPBF367_39500 [Xanthomonas arboricola pv. juglandis]|nr:hypothetical protein CPBF367_39500 [Xanthomonas arboricola pv. juglandis]
MQQRRRGDSGLAGRAPDLSGQYRLQRGSLFDHIGTVGAHIQDTKGRARFAQRAQLVDEIVAVLAFRGRQRLDDGLAELTRTRQPVRVAQQDCHHLLDDQRLGHVIAADMMMHQRQHEIPAFRFRRQHRQQHRCLLQVKSLPAGVTRGEKAFHGRTDLAGRKRLHHQRCLAVDHLDRMREPFPADRGAEDVVPGNDVVQRGEKRIQVSPVTEHEHHSLHIGIAIGRHHVVEQHPLLEWNQSVDILQIGGTAGRGCRDGRDVFASQARERKTVGRIPAIIGVRRRGKQLGLVPLQQIEQLAIDRPRRCPDHQLIIMHAQIDIPFLQQGAHIRKIHTRNSSKATASCNPSTADSVDTSSAPGSRCNAAQKEANVGEANMS